MIWNIPFLENIWTQLTAGRVPFVGSTKQLSTDSSFAWDNTNKVLTTGVVVENGVATVTTTGSITGLATAGIHTIRMNNSADATIHGMAAGVQGQRIRLISINGSGVVYFAHQSSTEGTATNRLINFATIGNTPILLGEAEYEYDGTTGRWRLMQHEQGGWITPTFAAGDFTGSGSMIWTVAAGDVQTMAFRLSGRTLYIQCVLQSTTIGGTVSNQLLIGSGQFGGFQLRDPFRTIAWVADSGIAAVAGRVERSSNSIAVMKLDASNWTLGTDNSYCAFGINVGVN